MGSPLSFSFWIFLCGLCALCVEIVFGTPAVVAVISEKIELVDLRILRVRAASTYCAGVVLWFAHVRGTAVLLFD